MLDNVFNIYVESTNEKTYLYSKKNNSDDLGYEYHILIVDKNEELIDRQIPNIIQIFQNKSIKLREIPKDEKNHHYMKFINYYMQIQSQQKKAKKH